jgi:hypothetical protein
MDTHVLAYYLGRGAGGFHPPRERGTQARDAGSPASAWSFFPAEARSSSFDGGLGKSLGG